MPPRPLPIELAITAVGMVSPVGDSAAQSFTSVRAGITRMRERPDIYSCLSEDAVLDDREPLVASAMRYLEEEGHRRADPAEWLGLMAGRALRDLLVQARLGAAELARTGVFLALPAAAGLGPESRDEIVRHLHNFAALDLLPHVQLAFGDRASPLALAEQAVIQLRERRIDLAAVGGVDSHLFRDRLAVLDREWRILSKRNPDGFKPGEAAAFFLIERPRDVKRRGLAPVSTLRGLANGQFTTGRGIPNTGAELAEILAPLLPASGISPLFVCDLNGESARTREWGYAVSRLGKKLAGGFALEHPASVLGDVGAATGASLVALAVQYLARKHLHQSQALVWAASDDGERRALLLERI
jgi:3-oxoacyl-[acyl-carrier-protein] synthase-1